MGRKKHQNYSNQNDVSGLLSKLSLQKRNDLNQQVEKLLKVTSKISTSQNPNNWESHLEINKILSKIRMIENGLTKILPKRNASSCQKLEEWMTNHGAYINGVEITEFEHVGYGLRAKKDITENELVVSVPRKLMLTSECIEKSEIESFALSDRMLQSMPYVTLALLVLLERFKEDSFWAPYINMLPDKYNTVVYFTPEQIMELKGSPTYESALKQCKNIARQYAYFYTTFQRSETFSSRLKEIFTFDHYRWAVSTVMTRQNPIPARKPEQGMVYALIPYWDMANHCHAKVTTDYNVDKEASDCFACRSFDCGSQFTMSYGDRSNHDLLVHNGFVDPGNPVDSLALQLGLSHSDPLRPKRASLLDSVGVPSSGGPYTLRRGLNPLHPHLLAFLRVFCMAEDDLDKWISCNDKNGLTSDLCCLDKSLDTKVCEFLLMRIKLVLSTYKTKQKEDEELLSAQKDMDPCLRLAVLQRLSEKIILNSTIEYINLKLQDLKPE